MVIYLHLKVPLKRAALNKEIKLKESIKDEVVGKAHEIKGSVKEMAGKALDKKKLEAEGLAEKLAGKVQNKVGQVEKVLGK